MLSGNFHTYYKFNPTEERMQYLPENLASQIIQSGSSDFSLLDIGCNEGDLTIALLDRFSQGTKPLLLNPLCWGSNATLVILT